MMRGLDHHSDAAGLEHLLDRIGDLRGQSLLNLQPLGEDLDHAGELGDPDDPFVRNVADPSPTNDRRDMMLAMAFEGDAAEHDHLVVALDLAECLVQNLVRVFVIAREIFAVSTHHTIGRLNQTVAIGVLANPLEYGAERLLGLGVADRRLAAARRSLKFSSLSAIALSLFAPLRAPRRHLCAAWRILKGAAYPATLEKSATACIASRNSFSNLSRFSRFSGSGSLTVTSRKKPSTGARSVGQRPHGALEILGGGMLAGGRAGGRDGVGQVALGWRRERSVHVLAGESFGAVLLFLRAQDVGGAAVTASRFLPSSVSSSFPSASTRRTIMRRSSWPGSANTASMRSCRAPFSRR